jgi:restriction endonuclease S subunit
MKLKHIAELTLGNPEADFWIIRRGNANQVGRPTREYSPEHIGVSVTRPDLVIPNYIFYVFEFLANQGSFEAMAQGTTNLKTISVKDLKNIPLKTS